jgi:hypothetical protein
LGRKEANTTINDLNKKNNVLEESIRQKDGLVSQKERRVLVLSDSLSASKKRISGLEAKYGRLEAEYEHLSDSIDKIPADSSYEFLVNEAYPYPGHLKYPFNEPQVKGIHLTYLENLSLDDMIENLSAQLSEKDDQLEIQDTVMSEQADQIMLIRSIRQDQDSIINNQDDVIKVQDKQIKKEKLGKRIWQGITGAVIILFTLFALSGG